MQLKVNICPKRVQPVFAAPYDTMIWGTRPRQGVAAGFHVAIAPKAFISARKSWYLVSVSEGTAGLGIAGRLRATTVVGISPKPDVAEAPLSPVLGLAAAAFAACSRLTRTEAGTMAVTVLSSLARGIFTTVDWPVKVDLVSFLACPTVAGMLGGGPTAAKLT